MRLAAIIILLFIGLTQLAAFKPSTGTARHVGTLVYAGTASCEWSLTSTSYASFSADTDCPTAVVTGGLSAAATKVPGFVMTVQQGMAYRITSNGHYNATVNDSVFRFTDGTTNTLLAGGTAGTSGVVEGHTGSISAIYIPASSGVKTIQVQAKAAANSTEITNTYTDLTFEVEQYPTGTL